MLIFAFGEAAVGKNHIAEQFASEHGFLHWDADLALTSEMRIALEREETFTQEMRERYVKSLIPEIKARLMQHEQLIVTQALYRNENRRVLREAFPEAKWWWVRAPQDVIEVRLRKRGDISLAYAAKMRPWFEAPDFPCVLIENP